MNCDAFERWIDDGGSGPGADAVLAHARECRRCGAALRAAQEIEALLAAPVAAPRGLTDRVMASVAVTAQERPRLLTLDRFPLSPALPWWVRTAFEPATMLATLLVAVMLWQGSALFGLAGVAVAQLAGWLTAAPAALAAPWHQPTIFAAAALGAAPLVYLATQQLYRWSAELVGPRHLVARPR